MDERKTLAQSSISRELRRKKLYHGTIFATSGVLILLISGAFLPAESLRIWGFPLFLIGGALITFGLLPYRKLTRLEMNPYRLSYQEPATLLLSKAGKDILMIPLAGIDEIKFIESQSEYGIGFIFNKAKKEKIVIKDQTYLPRQLPGIVDLYLPYFSKRAVEEIKEILAS